MNWWKAHHGIATDLKYAVVLRHINQTKHVTESNALRDVTNGRNNNCPVTRSDIVSVWVWLIDFSSQKIPRGSIEGIEIDEIAASLDLSDESVSCIIEAFRWKGMITGNVLTAFEKRQPLNDKTNAERQARHRAKLKLETERNALRNGTNALALAREDGDGDGEVLVVNDLYPTTEALTDGRTEKIPVEPVNGRANGIASVPSVRKSNGNKTEEMGDVLFRYMSGEGKFRCKPPDNGIISLCLSALGEHSVIDAAVFLRDLYVNNDQAPGRSNGPRKYAWFVSVLQEKFGGHA